MTSLIGSVLDERYIIEKRLGGGGFGAVYCAQDIKTQARVAIKVLRPEASANIEVRERFHSEVHLLGSLNHPHIVQIHDCGETADEQPFLVMEFLDGEDLDSRLNHAPQMPLAQVLQLADQVGSALTAAHHMGIIHRDIKPQNIFLIRCSSVYGAVILCKILDFGIAKFHRSVPLTAQNSILGTPAYMSPESIKGQSDRVDGRSDQWSLGVVLYRALSGRLPFDGHDPISIFYQILEQEPPPLSSLCPWLPARTAAAVMRALAKDQALRFASIADFLLGLQPEPAPAEPESPRRPRAPWLRGASLSGAAAGLLIAGHLVRSHPEAPRVRAVQPQNQSSTTPALPADASAPPAAMASAVKSEPPISSAVTTPQSRPARSSRETGEKPLPGASLKSPRPSSPRTSKEDIHALFGREYLDLAPVDSDRVR